MTAPTKYPHFQNGSKIIACVTGASGTVGRSITKLLHHHGFFVRLLKHKQSIKTDYGQVYKGSLDDKSALESFLSGAQLLFHCAAEIRNPKKIWHVNVQGTKTLFEAARSLKVNYFCHISSAGVVGPNQSGWINEETKCQPGNLYEKSKLAAEHIVAQGIDGGRVVILRPTNVVTEKHHGILEVVTKRSLKNRLKLSVVGGECSHVVHADNVAAAALHCMNLSSASSERYMVSCDHEPGISFAELEQTYRKIRNKNTKMRTKMRFHLPIIVPFMARKCMKRKVNMGDVKYSSKKLLDSGFTFPLDVEETMQRIVCAENGNSERS